MQFITINPCFNVSLCLVLFIICIVISATENLLIVDGSYFVPTSTGKTTIFVDKIHRIINTIKKGREFIIELYILCSDN